MTLQTVRSELAVVGISIRKTEFGEYRVNFKGGSEATAYYTNSLSDARDTGLTMAKSA